MSSGLSQMFVLGYAQGYLAYLLHPDDYWMGGYESASSLMGPGFGRYLIERGTSIAGLLADDAVDLDFTPLHLPPDPALDYEPLVDERALGEPAVEAQSPEGADQVWIEWVGGGPLTDAPRVHLQKQVETNWVDVVHPSGQAITSGGPEIELLLTVEPSYEAQLEYSERIFRWTARMPRIFSVTPPGGQLTGTYRFIIEGVSGEAYRLVGAPFSLGAP